MIRSTLEQTLLPAKLKLRGHDKKSLNKYIYSLKGMHPQKKMYVHQHQYELSSSSTPLSPLPSLPPSIFSIWNSPTCLLTPSKKLTVESGPILHLRNLFCCGQFCLWIGSVTRIPKLILLKGDPWQRWQWWQKLQDTNADTDTGEGISLNALKLHTQN